MAESNVDKRVLKLFKDVQERQVAIQKAEKSCWETSTSFSYNPNSAHDRTDIRTVTDTRKLIEMYSFLKAREAGVVEAAEELGIKDYKFTWMGYHLSEWLNDFRTRINQIQIKEKKAELIKLETKLNQIMSPELKAKLELEAIEADLEKLG